MSSEELWGPKARASRSPSPGAGESGWGEGRHRHSSFARFINRGLMKTIASALRQFFLQFRCWRVHRPGRFRRKVSAARRSGAPNDERGSANHMKPESVLRATQAHQDRRGDRAGARARPQHAVLRHAPLRRAHQAHVHEPVLQPPRQQRGDRDLRDRPGGHAVRRLRAPDARRQLVQLLQGERELDAQRIQQAGCRESRHADDARRADRRRGRERRGDARRHLRDHGPGPAGRAEAPERDAAGRATRWSSTPAGASCRARRTRAT